MDRDNEDDLEAPTEFPSIITEENEEDLSFGEVLTQAKGSMLKFMSRAASPSWYITSIMNNYIVFQSPVYKTMYISLNHLKWLIPYAQNDKTLRLG